jgi:small subunit ribosomal protein S24e
MSLKIKILSQKRNPLLKRQEVTFEVDHSQEGETSTRVEVRQSLANMLKVDLDRVFVERVETKTGTTIALGEANAYESPEQARLVEREHIIARNAPPAKSEEPKEEVKPAAKPAAPKPEADKEQAPPKPKAEEAPKPTPKPEAAKAAAPKPAAKPDTQGAKEAKEAKEAPAPQEVEAKAPKPEAEKAVKQEG